MIGQGPKLRDMAVACSSCVKPELKKEFVDVLVELGGNSVILLPPLKAKGFASSTDKDYDLLRSVLKSVK